MFQIWCYNKELERQQEENAEEGENLGLDEKTVESDEFDE